MSQYNNDNSKESVETKEKHHHGSSNSSGSHHSSSNSGNSHHHSSSSSGGSSTSHHSSNSSSSSSSSRHSSNSSGSSHRHSSSSSGSSHRHSSNNSSGSHRHHHHKHREYSFEVTKDDDVPYAKYRKIHREPKRDTNPKSKKKSLQFKVAVGTFTTIISIFLVITIVLTVLIINGKNSLVNANSDSNMNFPNSVVVEDDYIMYNGHKYKYNKNITTLLISGVDRSTDQHIKGVVGTGGQADAIFLVALDTQTGVYKIMALSRDSMADVNVMDSEGNFTKTENMQICLAHAYGDGYEKSNENLKQAVSRLFFGININSYITMDLDAIPVLNDSVGGVNVTVIEDLTQYNPKLALGKNVTLVGGEAETYVRSRDITGDENQNNLRMARQQDYLTSFINEAIAETKKDIRTPINMYNDVKNYARTDFDTAKIAYLASIFMSTGFSADENMVKVPGKTVMGKEYAEYHVDDDELLKMVINTYYERVD